MLSVAISIVMESTSIVVLVPSYAPPMLIVPYIIIDIILGGEGATKGNTTNYGKAWA
jgi:hypothetical protein